MPVDFFVCIVPVLIIVATFFGLVAERHRRIWRWIAGGLAAVFVLIYFVPGWVYWCRARSGDREAQYELGNYYWTRLGYNWSNVSARDKWWLEAAKQGHPEAMHQVGYFSMCGTSKYIPMDLVAARRWLEAAKAAGVMHADESLEMLAEQESKAH
jgi:TPR repeat protein